MELSVPQAQARLGESIQKRSVDKIVLELNDGGHFYMLSKSVDVHASRTSLEVAAPYREYIPQRTVYDGKESISFKNEHKYIQAYSPSSSKGSPIRLIIPRRLFNVGFLPNPERAPLSHQVFAWSDEAGAQEFTDAFNRLLYACRVEDYLAFTSAAKAWRENPAKPPLLKFSTSIQLYPICMRVANLSRGSLETKITT